MQDFRNIIAWQRAHQLTLAVYACSRTSPQEERFDLRSQMQRAAASVAADIAESSSRKSDRYLARFLEIAVRSLTELQYFLILARDLGFVERLVPDQGNEHRRQTFAALTGLMRRVASPSPPASTAPQTAPEF